MLIMVFEVMLKKGCDVMLPSGGWVNDRGQIRLVTNAGTVYLFYFHMRCTDINKNSIVLTA